MSPGPPTPPAATPPASLWRDRGFILINLAMLLVFVNLAIFFGFFDYLTGLGVAADSAGSIISAFALAALVVRPLVSPLLTPANARRWALVGAAGVFVALALYRLPQSYAGLLAVRVLHGGIYALLAASVMTLLVGSIPPGSSGRAFGLLGIITVLPYALVPPVLPWAEAALGGFIPTLTLTAGLMLLVIPMVRWGLPASAAPVGGGAARLTWPEVRAALADRAVAGLLLMALCLYASFSAVFYFMNTYAAQRGATNPGWFFTLAMGTEIGVRLLLGSWMDRGSKPARLAGALVLLALAYLGVVLARGPWLLAMGLVFGLAWGVAMPLINGLIFDLSTPRLRPLNANLGMQAFQGGFFLGPLLGGAVVDHLGYGPLFLGCAGLCLLGLWPLAQTRHRAGQGDRLE